LVRLLRATLASVICLVTEKEHILTLIARASKGDRDAVISLVKVDKFFLRDACCEHVIRRTQLQEDKTFGLRLANALEYQPRVERRDALNIYFYILCLFEVWGIGIPRLNDLWRALDRHSREYDSLEAFEESLQTAEERIA
jgi:hypothetical protein